jgi:hypothetical protein
VGLAVIESRTDPTPTEIEYMDSMIGSFRTGGFSIDLTHHAMHAMGSRLLGFSQELFDDTPDDPPEIQAIMFQRGRPVPTSPRWSPPSPTTTPPSSARAATTRSSRVALDLMLHGLERLRERDGSS